MTEAALARPAEDVAAGPSGPALLEIADLRVRYATARGSVTALDGVSFNIAAGETVGLVGESGCGKSTLSKAILRLVPASSGTIRLGGTDITALPERALAPHRRRMQMVFQDPSASLNPRQTVFRLLDTVLKVHGLRSRAARRERVMAMLGRVGLAEDAATRLPHEFSGGQRQRIGIARALILHPELVICDEPVSALDLSVQAQVLNLLVDLRRDFGLSYLFISHDLAVVRYIADRIIVMYLGRIVESMDRAALLHGPRHPYTRALLSATPGRGAPAVVLRGEASAGAEPGCRFRARCPVAVDRCAVEDPALRPVAPGHAAACHLAETEHA